MMTTTTTSSSRFPSDNAIVQCVNDCSELALSSFGVCSDLTCQEFLDPSWSREQARQRRRQRQRKNINKSNKDMATIQTISKRHHRQRRGVDAPATALDDNVSQNYNNNIFIDINHNDDDDNKIWDESSSITSSRFHTDNPIRSEPEIPPCSYDYVTKERGWYLDFDVVTREEVEDLTNKERRDDDGDDDAFPERRHFMMSSISTTNYRDNHHCRTDSSSSYPVMMITNNNSPSTEKSQIRKTFWPSQDPSSWNSNNWIKDDDDEKHVVPDGWDSSRFQDDNSSNQSLVSNTGSVALWKKASQSDDAKSNLVSSSGSMESMDWKRARLKMALQKFLQDDTTSSFDATSWEQGHGQDPPSFDRYHI
jgi:hypothetical protein